MATFRHPLIAELYNQSRFAPRSRQIEQLFACQELAKILKPDQNYPYELVCYRLTGFQPKHADVAAELIS